MPDDERELADTQDPVPHRGPVDPGQVRGAIQASWWRSRQCDMPADRIDLPCTSDVQPAGPPLRGTGPVLQRLADQLDGQPISLIVTDPTGVVLAQRTGDLDLHRHLEHAELVPGVSYGAQYRGTNGIGTTLGGRQADARVRARALRGTPGEPRLSTHQRLLDNLAVRQTEGHRLQVEHAGRPARHRAPGERPHRCGRAVDG